MNLIGLQLEVEAQVIVGDLLDGLEEDNGWFSMTVRIAAQIDTALREGRYVGVVRWFSEADFIEESIEYLAEAE